MTPLAWAAQRGYLEVATLLLERDVSTTAAKDYVSSPHCRRQRPAHAPPAFFQAGKSPLDWATTEEMKTLLRRFMPPTALMPDEMPPPPPAEATLHDAAKSGDAAALRTLLDAGGDVSAKDKVSALSRNALCCVRAHQHQPRRVATRRCIWL